MKNKYLNKIIAGDALEILPQLAANSIDLVLTDPPYFLDKLDNQWNHKIVSKDKTYCQVIQSLPPGMKFDKKQGRRLYQWFFEISQQLFRLLKPGGFFFSFSSPRLYHRLACAVEDAGFLIRDCFIWLYTQNQPKAMSLDHFIEKLSPKDKSHIKRLKEKLRGWKTPQVKSCFEPIVMAQKPTDGTFLNNVIKHKIGLVNTNIKIGANMFPANVVTTERLSEVMDRHFLAAKPAKEERGEFNLHKTVKPLAICEYLIALTTFRKNAIVLDPFVGSGTTAVAAKRLGRRYIGVDVNPEYIEIALKRLRQIENNDHEEYYSKKLQLKQLFYNEEIRMVKNK